LTEAAQRYHQSVSEAASYLAERGLWEQEAVDGFLLGFAADPAPGHEWFAGRLTIPYLTPSGVVGMKFRCIQGHDCKEAGHEKYLGPAGQKDRLYNVQALHEANGTVYITEGEIDALSATLAGAPAVGISGASKWQPHYAKVFEDFETVTVLVDGDDAGKDFAKRVRAELEGNVRVVTLPQGYDTNSYILEYGVNVFKDLIGR
jgi:DNA primase